MVFWHFLRPHQRPSLRIIGVLVVCLSIHTPFAFGDQSDASTPAGSSVQSAETQGQLELLREKAAAGDLSAMAEFAKSLSANNLMKNASESLHWFERAAALGHVEAAQRAALMYDRGLGVEENNARAAQLYLQAARSGDALSQYNLAWMFENGEGVGIDISRAFFWYQKAASQEFPSAITALANIYDTGRGLKEDDVKAIALYQQAANLGDVNAMYNLGVIYDVGQGIAADGQKAKSWYERAAKKGHDRAMYNLGLLFRLGNGVPVDLPEAYFWSGLAYWMNIEEAGSVLEDIGPRLTKAQRSEQEARMTKVRELGFFD